MNSRTSVNPGSNQVSEQPAALRLPIAASGARCAREEFRPSPDQQQVLDLGSGAGPVLVLGGPGTGKTQLLVEAAANRIVQGELDAARILIVAPTRLAAARLRDDLTTRLDRSLSAPPARTWSSYAFDLIRRARVAGLLPELSRAPRLLSGAEQDLIIKELLEGHRRLGVLQSRWPESLQLALGTRGFRQEVRELFDRVSEYSLHAEDLADFGRRFDRPDWTAAAGLYREYRDVLDLRMPEAFDPAGILTAARGILEHNPEFLAAERSKYGLILVDDYQESNTAIHALCGVIAEGKDTIVTACPDTVVQGFRGARPELAGRLSEVLGEDLRTMALTTSHRLPASIASAWFSVASRTPVAGTSVRYRNLEERNAPVPAVAARDTANAGTVSAHVVDSGYHEHRYIAQRILEAHVEQERSFDDIAVITRTGAHVSELQRYLAAQDIPVSVPPAERAIRDEPAVQPLLDILAVLTGARELEAELAVSIMTSRIGGSGALEIRRLRQLLRREERLSGGERDSDHLIVDALSAGAVDDARPQFRPVRRLSAMLAAGRAALEDGAGTPETVLWAIWSASGLSARWEEAALKSGLSSARADRDLDAVVALFETAERYVDQMPGAPTTGFLEYLLSQELPMDTLAARAQKGAAVAIMTPAAAAGRQWPFVIVAGVQEGVWPNLRIRGELLGSGDLVALLEHGPEFRRYRDPHGLMQLTRADELRSFSAAISRAAEELLCVAVDSEDLQPSSFLDIVDPLPTGQSTRPRTVVMRPLTLRALVAELRKYAQQPDRHPDLATEAVHHLGVMAHHEPEVPGAHPDQWWGLASLSSTEPVVPADALIPVSPSKVEAVLASPLNWFVSAAGGERPTDFARTLGTLVHSIAQDLPDATGNEYAAELIRRWPTLGMKDTWEGKADLRRAEQMVRKLGGYLVEMRRAGRTLESTEVDFDVELPVTVEGVERIARLRGQVDRLELDHDGRLFIIDLKTGKSAPQAEDVAQHAQLAAYQVAATEAGFQTPDTAGTAAVGGAALVHLGTATKGPKVQEQPPLGSDDSWAHEMIEQAAGLMSAVEFDAIHDPKRSGYGPPACRLPEICPLCAEGRQVTE
ncbi:superfamily I DNA/RNA helicase/RecB family exonuclease [Arthrobacter pigmenti]|uniref:DNA 3'-5' helicase n=1 Tax=Arthrobacter pigmenti TaxID=271432 RepID=A0A846RPH2_9MICC|nr:ATP-dependent DNA helicase [Arthrobacter pigmenti]NJC22979.1 superfamily I DNA/RNA helicase/RecB family exonuclease [Arthrobacter pigmenti]